MEQEMNQKLDDLLEIVTFIKDNAVPHEEFSNFRDEVNERFDKIETDIRAIRADISDIKTRLTALEKNTTEDINAMAQEITALKERLSIVEQQLATRLKAQQPA